MFLISDNGSYVIRIVAKYRIKPNSKINSFELDRVPMGSHQCLLGVLVPDKKQNHFGLAEKYFGRSKRTSFYPGPELPPCSSTSQIMENVVILSLTKD